MPTLKLTLMADLSARLDIAIELVVVGVLLAPRFSCLLMLLGRKRDLDLANPTEPAAHAGTCECDQLASDVSKLLVHLAPSGMAIPRYLRLIQKEVAAAFASQAPGVTVPELFQVVGHGKRRLQHGVELLWEASRLPSPSLESFRSPDLDSAADSPDNDQAHDADCTPGDDAPHDEHGSAHIQDI